ncbi:MAG: galactokinase family protein, partial [Lachnospiraceae bacterium]|nr:galactokinase family protein [Lachnospiraceae bacterium]
SAPARTEVCGDHTYHQNGMVLTSTVNIDIIAVAAATDTKTAHIDNININCGGEHHSVLMICMISANFSPGRCA